MNVINFKIACSDDILMTYLEINFLRFLLFEIFQELLIPRVILNSIT